VALDPIVAERFAKLGCKVLIECGAGLSAQQPDSAYASAEAVPDRKTLLGQADVLFKVQPPTLEEADALKEGAVVISFMQAHRNTALVAKLRDRRITAVLDGAAAPHHTRAGDGRAVLAGRHGRLQRRC
jgi:H+-translocating NAD(P) transhydrogenase subunit alpha